ncbi:hypothetical protein HMJ29_12660 [Hymenobacter taeanensis]|uniref:Uncharacterized protein n=1 Tax=Hymenobacter taeanensis TaxID=2735321 RepID=A0A6M6BI20_9BACT|nr:MULTISPECIES: hypothetical protein [Hymenobacter]QJX47746.1 hypothetical protein HMJ29_12660 [Hymenobacter taeanensis]UOQ82767.1 hypothetical protein MUN83_08410 [Hymenobacter sp. 5414T-23]
MQKIILGLLFVTSVAFVLTKTVFKAPPSKSLHSLPNIGLDTIKLGVGYAGCGEWGGRRELIKVFQGGGEKYNELDFTDTTRTYFAEYWVDSLECSYRTDRRYRMKVRKLLTLSDESLVLRYMQDFIPATLKRGSASDYQYGSSYYMKFQGRNNVVLHYPSAGKDVFQELRAQLYSK